MKKQVTYITTWDTNETYEFSSDQLYNDNPQLYEVSMTLLPVGTNGNSYGIDFHQDESINVQPVYIELDTVLKAGLKPYQYKKKEDEPQQEETAEDLMIRLLETLGFYPVSTINSKPGGAPLINQPRE